MVERAAPRTWSIFRIAPWIFYQLLCLQKQWQLLNNPKLFSHTGKTLSSGCSNTGSSTSLQLQLFDNSKTCFRFALGALTYRSEVTQWFLALFVMTAHSHCYGVTAADSRGILQETHFSLALLCECYFFALLHAPLLVPYKLSLAYLTSLTSPSLLTKVHAVERATCKKKYV